jgi:hypothetical protein
LRAPEGPVLRGFSLFTPGQGSPSDKQVDASALINVNNKLVTIVAILAIFCLVAKRIHYTSLMNAFIPM